MTKEEIEAILKKEDRYMTITQIADRIDRSYYHVARILLEMYWEKPHPMTRWKQGRKVKYRWRTRRSG
jgi:phosphate uptake regulator